MKTFFKIATVLSIITSLAFSSKVNIKNSYKPNDCYYTFIVAEYSNKFYVSNIFNTCEFIKNENNGISISKKLYNDIVQTVVEKYNLNISMYNNIEVYLGISNAISLQKYIPYENYLAAKKAYDDFISSQGSNAIKFEYK